MTNGIPNIARTIVDALDRMTEETIMPELQQKILNDTRAMQQLNNIDPNRWETLEILRWDLAVSSHETEIAHAIELLRNANFPQGITPDSRAFIDQSVLDRLRQISDNVDAGRLTMNDNLVIMIDIIVNTAVISLHFLLNQLSKIHSNLLQHQKH